MNRLNKLLIISALGLLGGCDNQVLLTELSQRQSNEVLAVLQENGVEGTRRENGKLGSSIKVARGDFVTAVDLLRLYNLPSKEQVEIIQAFPGDSLVASPQAERSRLLSLIEQRLQQSLLTIPGVVNARVHVSYPLSSNNRTKQLQQVSSLVTYAGNEDPKQMMNKIKLFLTNSFTEASYDNVSVVVVERPPLQRQVSHETKSSLLPVLLASIAATLVAGTSILLLLRRRKQQSNTDELPSVSAEQKS
ncbi:MULTISPECIES: type III secretion system inner membrane ring lipoprotein SctJ [Yersinia]|jgi:type III secretion system YscJ/HrcJ family lipoprotein|uniref:Lipoprotein n=2 Tax=Yersinia TaxID=629 RepID=A0AAI9EP73_YERFR|nr:MULTISPECIES: type III secretion inner membrane ring lipoprotein SctJ [Yersinia]AVX39888.1 EscJ/YscJ/HrcJ family type III secretion inner membrane ring protein [Yersinia massiliensis]MDN0126126.1 type III secretion inner membrane ring lipoprotein SctJ [Yersinia massiliensis]QKJ10617.1 type III secretion inner membrane ring lipoprotein SctJ [Yersinia massiliensis]CFQ99513.1 type III secretion system apparatus lipoprotein [Yersinia frederiksenii]